MPRSIDEIIADLHAFQPGCADWGRLDSMITELWQLGSFPLAIEELLGVFERFPEDDGQGIFWTILHGLEKVPGYEAALVRSVAGQPSEFGVLMVGRLLNAGIAEVNGISLVELLESVLRESRGPDSVRQTARDFVDRYPRRSHVSHQAHAEPSS